MKPIAPSTPAHVLEVEDLNISYETPRGEVEAVREVSFTIGEGETLGLVGESGCGKSTVAYGIVGFLGSNGKISGGSVRFQGDELVGRSEKGLRSLRGDRIAMVYQDPMQALNPSMILGEQLAEVLTCHRFMGKEEAEWRAVEMLKRVHMPDPGEVMRRYPHQVSGGQQQRIVIAMAMLNHPSLLIMDEPTTALDVTVEAAVLDLIEELKGEFRMANLFITHNLGVVARISDRLCVMYAGEMVERGPVRAVFKNPCHPYTMGLLQSVPRLGESKWAARLRPIRGRVPSPGKRPGHECIFAPRCEFATGRCRDGRPGLKDIGAGQQARCLYAGAIERPDRSSREKPAPEVSAHPDGSGRLLRVQNLAVYYHQQPGSAAGLVGLGRKKYVKAVDGVNMGVSRGRTLGVVGESGCGKSTLVKGIIGLERITGGDVEFMGVKVTAPASKRHQQLIQEMQMVFQNPDSTLNPAYPVGRQIARPLRKFKTVPRRQVKDEVIRLLHAVRLGSSYYGRFPRQLSGGEKQRIGIARALASRPDLLICDEPVSSLDVSVQAAVVNLLLDIQAGFGSSMIFIAHDLSVVRFLSDDIAVMYLGRIVEIGPAESIYSPPYHPYTEALLSAVPIPDPDAERTGIRLSGNVPSALNPPAGCAFHTRCPRRGMLPDRGRICERELPPWRSTEKGHRIFCHLPVHELKGMSPVAQWKV